MGLFSKKKLKEEQPAGTPAKGMPSLGLPVNNPGGAKPAAAPATAAPAAAPKPTPTIVSAEAKAIPVETPGAPTIFELPDVKLDDVKLEETGFTEAPSAGTGSMTLKVELPDPVPGVPATAGLPLTPPPVADTLPPENTPPPISLTPPGPDASPLLSVATAESMPPIALAAPVTDVAKPEFKPPKITLDVGQNFPAQGAPSPEGLKTQVLPARAFRVVISPLHRLAFRPNEMILKAQTEAKLSNISTSGAGVVASDFLQPPATKTVIAGSLVFESGPHPVQLEVMHVTSGVIGCKFVGEKLDSLREAIKKFFELELLALGMLKVNPAHHKAEADGIAHWIHGDQCELFYVTDTANKLVRFRLTFLGNRFVWTKAGGLNVGQVIDDRVGIMRTDRIAVMDASPEIVELAVRFLQNIPQVPQEHRDQIAGAISPGNVAKPKAS